MLGKGHLAAKLEGESSLIYAQVPFVESDVIEVFISQISGA